MELPKDYLYRLYRMPSIRYHDTAFVIYSKWLRSEDELAFPLVHKYVLTSKEEKKKKLSSSNSKPDHYMTDSECTYSTETRKRKDHDDNEKQSPNRQRRRTRSLEKCERLVDLVDVVDNGKQLECPRKNNGKLKKSQSSDKFETVSNGSNSSIESLKPTKIGDDQNNNNNAFGHETIKLEIVESQSNHSIKSNKSKVSIAIDSSRVENVQLNISEQELNRMQVDQKANCDVIAVDIHPRPISGLSLCLSEEKGKNEQDPSDEVLLITEPHEENIVQTNNDEDDIVEMRHLSIDGRNSRASDISDTRTIISEMSSSTRKIHTLSDSMSPSPIGRKRLGCGGISNSISSIATSSFSDDITSDQESTDEYGLAELRRMSERQPYRTPYGHQSLQKSNQNGTNDHIAIQKSQTFPAQPNHYPKSDKLRLHYVTQRILASVLPRRSSVVESLHNNNTDRPHTGKPGRIQDQHEEEVIAMLEQKHGKNYRLFDLESCISVITLERICELCKHIDVWLAAGQENVVVLQDREDRQRLGTAIAAYLEYMNICASNYQTKRNGVSNEDLRAQNTIARNWLDLDIFSMKKFLEDFIGPLRIPSHGRYIRYFSGLLSGQIKLNSSAIHLKYINIESPPSWLQYNGISSKSEWNSFIKIYEGLQCVYTSDIHIIPIATRQFLYQIGNLRLRGDILIRCYQIITADNHHHHHHHNYNRDTRELLFSLQFHTCAIKSNEVTFAKDDLDYACHDQRFPNECKVTFQFNAAGGPNENGFVFQSPLIRTVEPNELAKADSILNLNSGPVDGSLYATILKSPKTPQFPNDFQPNYEAHLKAKSSKNPQTIVISPPPQFSNGDKSFEIIDRQPVSTSTPIRNSIAGGSILREYTQTPSRETSAPPRSDYSYVESRPATSQSNYRDSTNSNKPQQPSSSSHHNITVIETFHNSDNQRIPTGHQNQNHHQNGTRESVRSPLTLSMDSGISSSGLLIRPQQRSSVSPSSFPSQSSPQEDRDRELDDILSDMLMTVQDIPDYRNGSSSSNNNIIKSNSHNHNSTTATQKIVRSQSVIPTTATTFGQQQQHHQHHLQQQHHQHHHSTYTLPTHHNNYNRDILKRSQSYISHENVGLLPSANNNLSPYLSKDRDPYDTASTTTTLTPPPSESGRDTPIQISGSNISTLQHQRHRRDTSNSMASQSQHSGSNNHLVSSQHHNHQSSIYPQSVRSQVTDTIAISEDEDHNIPYHAREHSQPFTYGNVPNGHQLNEIQDSVVIVEQDPRMIKAQSGLTSPMLVRKTFGSSSGVSGGGVNNYNNINSQTILRKTPTRNDFEDMLRDRREKVMSEKYSIGDKQLSATNGYHYYNEPLKRSNTLDGFRRNTTTTITTTNINDENSGQSWLQLQQQKLRAKKDQLRQDERKYYEEIHTEMRNRPHRAKRNVHYDGYASDTAAFADEVDYRRPLHVQTPYNASRSPERNYHTLTKTTTTTVSKERPFVAVKRAHEFAKNEKIGSPSSSLQPLTILKESPNGHIVQAQSNNNNISNNISNNNNSNKQNGLLSMAEQTPTRNGQTRLMREESFSSYRSETEPELSIAGSPRPETPAFPVTPRTPYGFGNGNVSPALPPKSPNSQRRLYNSAWSLRSQLSTTSTLDTSKDLFTGAQSRNIHEVINQNDTIANYTTRRNSNASSEPQEVAPHHVKFVRDSSKYWYKPSISREEAIALLRNASPGSFVVRDSTTYNNAYGLVVRVAQPPPGVTMKPGGDELVRHFLIEPTTRGVRLKGSANEPVFSSLSALVYQHSITQLALPCRLVIPDRDIQMVDQHTPAQKQLLSQGAACNVLYLYACDTESLTGEEAVRRAVNQLYSSVPLPQPIEVHFKVAKQGITLTDNSRKKFFRKHYAANIISFCGLDPENRLWSVRSATGDVPINKNVFAFVARRSATSTDNQCHIFCDLTPNQPATAIVSFANKILPTEKHVNYNI